MKYLIIYLEIEHMLNFLSQSEKGDFLDLMIVYAKNQEDPVIENKNVLNVFNFIRGRLDVQFDKARIKAEVARKNGTGGGRPTVKKKPKKTQSKPNETQLVIEEQFEKFWNLYNKKTGKPDAERRFKAALKITTFESLMTGLSAYVKARDADRKYWKDPSTWLNKQCWKDEYNSNIEGSQSNTNESLTLFINNLIGHTLIKSIGVSASNKAVLQFTNKACFDSFVKMKDELKNEAKDKITKELSTNGFEPKY